MKNTNSCESCSQAGRYTTKEIFGKSVRVKNYICSPDGKNYECKNGDVKLYMSVCPQSYCPASCPFCIATRTKERLRIDTAKFEKTLRGLKDLGLIKSIKITGGEPFYDFELLSEVVEIIFEVFGLGFELSISTNGTGLDKIHRLKHLSSIDALHISRHHYDDEINRSLFGNYDVPSGAKLKEIFDTVAYKDIFVFNCMLLKDYINSPEQAHKFMDFAIETGASKVGFMCCAQVNGFAREQAIRYEDVIREGDSALLFTRGYYDYDFCHCRDGVYASEKGGLIEFYGRDTRVCKSDFTRAPVYDSDNYLKDGFGGNIII